eukprot:1073671_1
MSPIRFTLQNSANIFITYVTSAAEKESCAPVRLNLFLCTTECSLSPSSSSAFFLFLLFFHFVVLFSSNSNIFASSSSSASSATLITRVPKRVTLSIHICSFLVH